MSLHPLTFKQLRKANVERSEAPSSGFNHMVKDWSPCDWATALAGEVGEACNLIKKARRGEPIEVAAVADELADAAIYLDLLAARLGVDLGRAIAHKFNDVSRRRGSILILKPEPGTPCPLGMRLDFGNAPMAPTKLTPAEIEDAVWSDLKNPKLP